MLKTFIRSPAATYALAGLLPAALIATPLLAPFGLSPVPAAHAQPASDTEFVRALSVKLAAVVNGPGSTAEKKTQVLPLLSQDVDVDAIGRFCLGRFWRTATPEQQQRYLTLFHQVLVNSITGHLGDYKGVAIAVGNATAQDEGRTSVPTVISRPGQPNTNVQWIISNSTGSPKVIDVMAEGVSLRINERDDYTSYLARHGNNVDALITALTRQVSHSS